MKNLYRAAFAAALLFVGQAATAQQAAAKSSAIPDPSAAQVTATQATGKLVFEVKPFTSEVPLKKKIESQLQSGGIEWGVKNGLLVIAVINKRFIDFDITHMTRFGQNEQLDLPAGEYHVTCAGFEPHTGFSVDKLLARGGYFNENIVTFTIEPGKTTTLSLNPIMKKDQTFFLTVYMPTLMTSVTTEAGSTPEKAINLRQADSISWPAYTGPLKFIAK